MAVDELLAKAGWLLSEFERDAHALPVRLRVLNMFTYTLDRLYMQAMPPLIAQAGRDRTIAAQVQEIARQSTAMLNRANEGLRTAVAPIVSAAQVRTVTIDDCTPAEREWLARYFARSVQPLLTPLAVDAGRPFPQISAHSLNLLAAIERGSQFDVIMPSFARLKIPRAVPRMVEIPLLEESTGGVYGGAYSGGYAGTHERKLMLSEDLVRAHVAALFPGIPVLGVYQFRLLRGAMMEQGMPVGRHMALARQKAWPVVRIDVEQDMPEWVVRWLQENLDAGQACVLRRYAPLGIGSLAGEWAERITEFARVVPA